MCDFIDPGSSPVELQPVVTKQLPIKLAQNARRKEALTRGPNEDWSWVNRFLLELDVTMSFLIY
jgi:hypothetical protein